MSTYGELDTGARRLALTTVRRRPVVFAGIRRQRALCAQVSIFDEMLKIWRFAPLAERRGGTDLAPAFVQR
jgi:hypothetical protein